MKHILRRIFAKSNSIPFSEDPSTGIRTRQYNSYAEYITHQQGKLAKIIDKLQQGDIEYEQVIYERYASRQENWQGKRVICLAARLGGEVRAFKRLGALAIGIDIEPGPENHHVLYGDFHDIQFPDACFDIAFTNALDHVLDLENFLQEIARLLVPQGAFYVEVPQLPPSTYEVIDVTNLSPILDTIARQFDIDYQEELVNQTSYAAWNGLLLCLRKKAFHNL